MGELWDESLADHDYDKQDDQEGESLTFVQILVLFLQHKSSKLTSFPLPVGK